MRVVRSIRNYITRNQRYYFFFFHSTRPAAPWEQVFAIAIRQLQAIGPFSPPSFSLDKSQLCFCSRQTSIKLSSICMICTHSQRPCFVVLSLFYERGGGENGSNQWLKKVFFPNRCVDIYRSKYILLRRMTLFFLDNSKKYSMLFFFQLRTPTFFLENTDRRGCEICVCARICDVFLSWHHCLFFD